jgi:flagellar protein FlaF
MPSRNHNQPHNPYASAAGAYGTNAQKTAADPREVEARVLLKSAQFLVDLQNDWANMTRDALEETLKYNRNIWMMFYDTAVESTSEERPKELRNNIYNLANFIFKREIEILAKPEKSKLDILININRNVAAGLLEGVKNAPMQGAAADEKTETPPTGGWESSA